MQVACLRCLPARKPLRRFSTLRRFPPFLPCRTPIQSISDTHPVDIGHRSDPIRKLSDISPDDCPASIGTLSALNRNAVRLQIGLVSGLRRNTHSDDCRNLSGHPVGRVLLARRVSGRAPISEPAIPTPGTLPVGLDLRAGHSHPRHASGRAGSPSRPHLPRRFRRKRPTFPSPAPRQGRAHPHPLPAGGTTAGLPNPSTPGEASRVANMLLWHLLCQK